MTPENRAKLLQALCFAIQAGQDGISDLLQDVILGEMDGGEGCVNVTFPDGEIVRCEREHTATREVRSYGAGGTCQCSECARDVDQHDTYCRACGARFIGTEYRRVE